MRRTQTGGYCLFKAAFSEGGRAWAAIPTARADRPGFGALGRAEARRPGGRLSWLNQLKKKKEHRHQARAPSIETYL